MDYVFIHLTKVINSLDGPILLEDNHHSHPPISFIDPFKSSNLGLAIKLLLEGVMEGNRDGVGPGTVVRWFPRRHVDVKFMVFVASEFATEDIFVFA